MPIVSTDILLKCSIKTGSAGNTTAGAVGTNLGKYVATTVVTDAVTDNFFPDVTGAENAASNVDYQCMFVHNSNPTLTLQAARVWIAGDISGGAQIALCVDPTPVSLIGASAAQAVSIANKNTAPAGVTPFTFPGSAAAALPLGDIGAGECRAFWIRRTSTNSAAQADGVSIRIDGDTLA